MRIYYDPDFFEPIASKAAEEVFKVVADADDRFSGDMPKPRDWQGTYPYLSVLTEKGERLSLQFEALPHSESVRLELMKARKMREALQMIEEALADRLEHLLAVEDGTVPHAEPTFEQKAAGLVESIHDLVGA